MIRPIALFAAIALAGAQAWAQEKPAGEAKKGAPAAETRAETAKKEPSEAQKRQQARMRACNEKAAERKLEGEARRRYMSACLKGEDPDKVEKRAAQREKMKACHRQAADKGLKGEERRRFMSECLKG